MRSIIIAITVLFVLASCGSGSADKKIPELANEMCDCFTGFQKDLSPGVLALLKKVSVSASPREEMQQGLAKLNPEEAQAFIEKFKQISDKGSAVNQCMQAFDQRHAKETTRDKKALTEKLLKQMQGFTNCPAGAAVVNIGLQQQGGR